jgi:hypothetical protein
MNSGTFWETCTACAINGYDLACDCTGADGKAHHSKIDVGKCEPSPCPKMTILMLFYRGRSP